MQEHHDQDGSSIITCKSSHATGIKFRLFIDPGVKLESWMPCLDLVLGDHRTLEWKYAVSGCYGIICGILSVKFCVPYSLQ